MITTRNTVIEVKVQGKREIVNPFEAELYGYFRRKDGKKYVIPGFYDGDNMWKIRFSDAEEGEWYYKIVSKVVDFFGETEGKIIVKGENKNTTEQIFTKGTHFVNRDGESIFLLGFECNFLFSLVASPNGHAKLDILINNIKEAGFNQVQVNTYAYDYSFRQGRTRENDYGPAYINLWEERDGRKVYNIDYFRNFDYMIEKLNANGIYVHLYLRVYNKFVLWDENGSFEDDLFYYQFISRYQAYPNIIWNLTKEGYFEGDKEYLYRVASKVKGWDAYHHLCTIHDDLEFALNPKYAHTIDFLTLQQHEQWPFAIAFYSTISGKPVVGGETGVESPKIERVRRYPAERVCEIAYETIMSGGYYQYYWAYAAWDVIEYDTKPKGFEYMRRLRDFFEEFDLSKFTIHPERLVWSGQALDDGKSTLLIYVEPAKHMPGFVNREGQSMLNLSRYGKIESVETFGVYSGRREPATSERLHVFTPEPERGFTKQKHEGVKVLHSYSNEPTMFIFRYSK